MTQENTTQTPMTDDAFLLETLPDSIVAWTELRARWIKDRPQIHGSLEWVVSDLQHWAPGDKLRVAFLGGSPSLHKDIVEVLQVIVGACNISFDFGYDARTGKYRAWSEKDQDYAAEIRVSFDLPGYFSLVGMDSVNASVGGPSDKVGGRPGQRSLNLGGYDQQRPQRWKGTVLHEFLHALGFHHEHGNLHGPCQSEFRWEDDPGYGATTDALGTYIPDVKGRRPGVYTYLGGYPNFWPRSKVDHNLRPSTASGIAHGSFDRLSVMLYRFPPLFYKTPNSPCAPASLGEELSPGDIEGLKRIYPASGQGIATAVERRTALLDSLQEGRGLEGASTGTMVAHAKRLLADSLARLRARVT